jgi:hypothetical protein
MCKGKEYGILQYFLEEVYKLNQNTVEYSYEGRRNGKWQLGRD